MSPGQEQSNSNQRTGPPRTSPISPAVPGSLESQIRSVDYLRQVRKADLHPGDCVFVKTLRSLYRIRVKENGRYEISGGWFDKKGLPPTELGISGCTWGGSAIKTDIVAACGLCVEFANRLITSPIQKIILLRQQNAQ
jgi:hypothetical protein